MNESLSFFCDKTKLLNGGNNRVAFYVKYATQVGENLFIIIVTEDDNDQNNRIGFFFAWIEE